MKTKMIEFLLKRLGSKVDEMRNADGEFIEFLADDIDVYLDELKILLSDVLL